MQGEAGGGTARGDQGRAGGSSTGGQRCRGNGSGAAGGGRAGGDAARGGRHRARRPAVAVRKGRSTAAAHVEAGGALEGQQRRHAGRTAQLEEGGMAAVQLEVVGTEAVEEDGGGAAARGRHNGCTEAPMQLEEEDNVDTGGGRRRQHSWRRTTRWRCRGRGGGSAILLQRCHRPLEEDGATAAVQLLPLHLHRCCRPPPAPPPPTSSSSASVDLLQLHRRRTHPMLPPPSRPPQAMPVAVPLRRRCPILQRAADLPPIPSLPPTLL